MLILLLTFSCSSTLEKKSAEKVYLEEKTERKIATYIQPGPYKYSEHEDFEIRISQNRVIVSDAVLSFHNSKAPLVIFQHGNRSSKEMHRNQARHVASWGFHALVVQQPNRHRWVENGHDLARLVRLLFKWPRMLDHRFLPNKIILVGHSFGGSAIAIAAGKRSPVKGLIFLDPALVNRKVQSYLEKINVPSVILGADKRVFVANKRHAFFRHIPANVIEISVKNSTHNDAQSPNMFKLNQFLGIKPSPKRHLQKKFMAAITASVASLSLGSTDRAWKLLTAKNTKSFIKPKRK